MINKKDVNANTRMDKLRKWLISQKSESAVDDLMTTLPDELLTQNIPSCPSMDDVLSSSSPAHETAPLLPTSTIPTPIIHTSTPCSPLKAKPSPSSLPQPSLPSSVKYFVRIQSIYV